MKSIKAVIASQPILVIIRIIFAININNKICKRPVKGFVIVFLITQDYFSSKEQNVYVLKGLRLFVLKQSQ